MIFCARGYPRAISPEEPMSTLITVIAGLATFVMTGLASAQQPPGTATTPPIAPIKRTILQKADVPGTNLELIYAAVEISAEFKAGRHNHRGVVMTQVIDGDF